MTPTYLNSAPSPFPTELMKEDQHHHLIFTPNLNQAPSSSSSLSSHVFFNSTDHLDQSANYHEHTQQLQYPQEGDEYDPKNESHDDGLKLTLWKKEEKNENQSENKSIKWMSSKMRLMRKMKNSDRTVMGEPKITSQTNSEDDRHKKLGSSHPMDTDHNSSNSSYFNNIPVRVCSDCNTTKTPLWRSGPRGPKSLCNACGIRQRKARRAMAAAAAAAAANGTTLKTESTTTPTTTTTPSLKIKIQNKEKKSNNTGHQVVPYKKRSKMIANSMTQVQKKLGFEDLVINLSKNLDFHRVFPQDEKEAAILLMALSCGLVHG